jgi:hypothetical protein
VVYTGLDTTGVTTGATYVDVGVAYLKVILISIPKDPALHENLRGGVGDGAWAVGDGQGSSRLDGVGLSSVGENSGQRAVSGQGSDNLSVVHWESLVLWGSWIPNDGGAGAGNEKSGGNGELHFD